MGWFGSGKASTRKSTHDIALRALQALLDAWAPTVPPTRRVRLDKLRARLKRSPLPSGLGREIEAVWAESRPGSGGREKELARASSDLTSALVDTMRLTALFDRTLTAQMVSLSEEVPRELGVPAARHLEKESRELRRAAIPARERYREERRQIALLVRELGTELSHAMDSSKEIDRGVALLVEKLTAEPDLAGLDTAKRTLVAQARAVSDAVTSLRKDLRKAEVQSSSVGSLVKNQGKGMVNPRSEAALDPLTRVCNRDTFDAILSERFYHASSTQLDLGLLLITVDGFAKIREEHKRRVGDKVLVAVAKRIQEQVRDGDLVARIKGDLFSLILPGADETVARYTADSIREAMRLEPVTTHRDSIDITVSIGLTTRQEGDTLDLLYERADKDLLYSRSGPEQIAQAAER